MKVKRYTKFGEESTCRFKIDINNLTNVNLSTQKSQKFHFNSLLLSRVYIVWAKKAQKRYISWNWRGIQNLEGNRLAVSKLASEIWHILTWALKSLKDFHFNAVLLSKVYIVWTKKVERELSFMTLKSDAKFEKNWLVAWKMT